jgi:long-chain fatty acid transport protein
MNFNLRSTAALLSAFGLTLLSGTAAATNGYFTHGVGTESKGMAGTGVGSDAANGPIIIASNPALGVFASDSWEVGMSAFSPMRSYKAEGGFGGNFGAFSTENGSFDSSSEWFPIPYVAKNWRLSNDDALTFVFYGRGGMNTDWDDSSAYAYFDPTGQGGAPAQVPGTFGGGDAGVDLMQAFLAVSYAGKVGDTFAWGIGPVFAVQMFEATGLGAFSPYTKTYIETFFTTGAPGNPDSLTNNGHDMSTGYGMAAGAWWAMGDYVSAGISYQSKMSMSEFKDYSDLFAEAGGFDIPSSAKIGLSFKGNNDVRFNIDVEQIKYSEVTSVGNPLANIYNCPTVGGTDFESCLGGKNGAGFGWDDMTTFKLGIEWTPSDTAAYRFGYSYGDQPINEDDVLFNILAPGVMEQHFTLGMSKSKPEGGTWNFSLMYAPTRKVKGISAFDPGQSIELEMSQFEFEVSYLW